MVQSASIEEGMSKQQQPVSSDGVLMSQETGKPGILLIMLLARCGHAMHLAPWVYYLYYMLLFYT